MNQRSNAFYVLSALGLKQQTYYNLMHKYRINQGNLLPQQMLSSKRTNYL